MIILWRWWGAASILVENLSAPESAFRLSPGDAGVGLGENGVIDEVRLRLVEYLPRLRRFAYALTGNSDLGDDLVQETCARALSRAELWRPGTKLDSWLFRIAQNLWLDRVRSIKTRGETTDIDSVPDLVECDGRDITENRLTLNEVQSRLMRLAPEQRLVVGLVCVEGLSYKEAADVLDVPIGTVMSRLARARRHLYESLHGGPPPPRNGG
jgi:RNA polymerase sigma-70 factor, ECF subfamily